MTKKVRATVDDIVKMELVNSKNWLRLAWYVVTRRALSIGYLISPNEYYKKSLQKGTPE